MTRTLPQGLGGRCRRSLSLCRARASNASSSIQTHVDSRHFHLRAAGPAGPSVHRGMDQNQSTRLWTRFLDLCLICFNHQLFDPRETRRSSRQQTMNHLRKAPGIVPREGDPKVDYPCKEGVRRPGGQASGTVAPL